MNRRDFIKASASTAILASSALMLISCNKKQIIGYSSTAVQFLEQTLPYFQTLIPGSTDKLNKAILVAKDLKTALEKESANAVGFINLLTQPNGLFQNILTDIDLIQDQGKKQIVAGILAIAGVALTLIENYLITETPSPILAKAKSTNSHEIHAIETRVKSRDLTKVLKSLKT